MKGVEANNPNDVTFFATKWNESSACADAVCCLLSTIGLPLSIENLFHIVLSAKVNLGVILFPEKQVENEKRDQQKEQTQERQSSCSICCQISLDFGPNIGPATSGSLSFRQQVRFGRNLHHGRGQRTA